MASESRVYRFQLIWNNLISTGWVMNGGQAAAPAKTSGAPSGPAQQKTLQVPRQDQRRFSLDSAALPGGGELTFYKMSNATQAVQGAYGGGK